MLHTGLMLINVSCRWFFLCLSLLFMPHERKIEAAAAEAAAVAVSVCPHIDADTDDGVHLHAFHSPMSNQSEHNIIIFQILVVLFCL